MSKHKTNIQFVDANEDVKARVLNEWGEQAMWKALGFGLCPATTHPKGQEVKGYYIVKIL